MNDITFYDFDFNPLCIENAYSSVDWVIKLNDIGTFEAHFPINSTVAKVCLENDYVVVTQGDLHAVITGKRAANDFTVYGRTPNWILTKFITPNFTGRNGTIEALSYEIVREAVHSTGRFLYYRVGGFKNKIDFWRNVYNPTFKVISECLARENAGHKVWFEPSSRKWCYKAIKPRDRGLVISKNNLNAYNITYSEDFQNHVNGGFYEVVDEETGESSWQEIASDKTGIYKWMGILGGDCLTDATESLKTRKWEKDTKVDVKDLKYGVNYNIGDIVTICTEIGDFRKTEKKIVKEVNIWFENGNSGERPVFGDV